MILPTSRSAFWAIVVGVVALASAHEAAALEPPPSLTIQSVTPNVLIPQGGTIATIAGTQFTAPVRVIIGSREAFIVSLTWTQIVIVTPSKDLGSEQIVAADLKVIVNAGTANEQSAVLPHGVTYASPILKPSIRAISPTSGPVTGGTRVALIGDGFQPPVLVTRTPDGAEAQVIRVSMNEIDIVTPPSETGPGIVGFSVWNVNSDARTTIENAFRYLPPAVIHSVGPLRGPLDGGTTITIDGENFGEQSFVTVAGNSAKVIESTPTRVVAVTPPVTTSGCHDITGPITVIDYDGNVAAGPQFTFVVPHPSITSIEVDGTTMKATVTNSGVPRFTFGGKTLIIGTTVNNGDGTTTYTLLLPTPPRSGRLVFTNRTTGCTATQFVRVCCGPQRGDGGS